MTTSFERVQIMLRPDQRAELARRARETKKSMAEITRKLLDDGIKHASEEDEFAKTRLFLEKAGIQRRKMPMINTDIAEFINDIREDDHD
jgi:hypothetical protein